MLDCRFCSQATDACLDHEALMRVGTDGFGDGRLRGPHTGGGGEGWREELQSKRDHCRPPVHAWLPYRLQLDAIIILAKGHLSMADFEVGLSGKAHRQRSDKKFWEPDEASSGPYRKTPQPLMQESYRAGDSYVSNFIQLFGDCPNLQPMMRVSVADCFLAVLRGDYHQFCAKNLAWPILNPGLTVTSKRFFCRAPCEVDAAAAPSGSAQPEALTDNPEICRKADRGTLQCAWDLGAKLAVV